MQVLAVLNSKGGAGKTTLTACLAVRASADMRTAVVDLDPQSSYEVWHKQRGSPDNPALLAGEERASDVVKALSKSTPYELLVIDGPTNALAVTEDAVKVASFIVIPMKPSMLDIAASRECIELCQEYDVPYLAVINDRGQHDAKLADEARSILASWKVPVAKTVIPHRIAYINAVTTGRTGPEKDKRAADDIDALWNEVRAGLRKAAKARAA